jgi:hypothetical protein
MKGSKTLHIAHAATIFTQAKPWQAVMELQWDAAAAWLDPAAAAGTAAARAALICLQTGLCCCQCASWQALQQYLQREHDKPGNTRWQHYMVFNRSNCFYCKSIGVGSTKQLVSHIIRVR